MNGYNFIKNCVFAVLLLAVSLPINVYSICCPTPCQTDETCCFDRTKVTLGALLVGAAAGAGTGYLTCQNHKHKRCKSKCDSDLCLNKKDFGKSLNFQLALQVDASTVFKVPFTRVTCTPTLTTPSGCTIRGNSSFASLINNGLSATCTGEIDYCDPECGIYHVGMEIDLLPTTILLESKVLEVIVNASRSDQSTHLQLADTVKNPLFTDPNYQILLPYQYSPHCCLITK